LQKILSDSSQKKYNPKKLLDLNKKAKNRFADKLLAESTDSNSLMDLRIPSSVPMEDM